MSTNQKPNAANAGGALAQLKEIWRRLPDNTRDYWREQLSSADVPLSQVRAEIFTKLKVKLSGDNKLSLFRTWVIEQDRRDQEAERQQDEERKIFSDHPDWTMDKIREEVLRRSYFRSMTSGDFEFGMKVLTADSKGRLKERELALEERRIALLEKKAAAFDRAKSTLEDEELSDEDKKAKMKEIFGL